MSSNRRIGAMVALATAAVGMTAAPAVAAPPGGPQPVSSWLRAVKAHSDSWVDIYWRTSSPVCDVKVAVAGRGVAVSYSGHRRFATLSRGPMLRPSRPDYTAVSVDPDFARPGVALLKTSIAYNDCSRHARTRYRNFTLTLPVQRNHNWPGHDFPGGPGNTHPRPGVSPSPVTSPAPSPSPSPAVTSSSAAPATTSTPAASASASASASTSASASAS
jgi:hypothetical protein